MYVKFVQNWLNRRFQKISTAVVERRFYNQFVALLAGVPLRTSRILWSKAPNGAQRHRAQKNKNAGRDGQ